MRIVIAGGRTLAVRVLEALAADGHEIVGVWTEEDDKLEGVAHSKGLPALIEPNVGDLAALEPDLLLSVHNFRYIAPEFLRVPTMGALGYHPSLLPRHKGNDSVRATIEAGDRVAGGSVYWLDEGFDTGPVWRQERVEVHERDDASTLWRDKLFPMGVRMLRECVAELGGTR